jgi:hypothetical protein
MSPDEEAAMRHFKGSIMRYVFEFFGTGCGFLVASTLRDADIQKIVIKEDDGDRGDQSDEEGDEDDNTAAPNPAAAAAHQSSGSREKQQQLTRAKQRRGGASRGEA